MAVTPASFKALFPEFSSQTDPRVQLFLDQASRRVDAATFGARADDALSYLTAHLLAVANTAGQAATSGASGPVSSKTVGPLSVSFASNWGSASGSGDNYQATYYGREYLTLVKLAIATPLLAWGC